MSHFAGQHILDDTGRVVFREHGHSGVAPMQSYNLQMVPKRNRQAPSTDVDVLPHQLRNFVNASGAQDVQINNGMQHKTLSGYRWGYRGAGWFALSAPIIPGQTRGDVAGFHRRGPAPINWETMWQNGPGSQPDNPGGPGRIAAPQFFNPMTG